MLPVQQCSAERAGFDRVVGVLEVPTELGHPLERHLGIAVRIELSHGFFGLPEGGHVAVGISGAQQAGELLVPLLVEPLLGLCEETSAPVERIGLAP